MPPGQHRHATPGRAVAPPGWTAADGARYNDTRGSWDRDGSDNLAITRSLCGHIDDTPRQAWEDPEALRPTASEGFQASSERTCATVQPTAGPAGLLATRRGGAPSRDPTTGASSVPSRGRIHVPSSLYYESS